MRISEAFCRVTETCVRRVRGKTVAPVGGNCVSGPDFRVLFVYVSRSVFGDSDTELRFDAHNVTIEIVLTKTDDDSVSAFIFFSYLRVVRGFRYAYESVFPGFFFF